MTKLHRSKVYADINSSRPRDNSDIFQFEVKWTTANLEIHEKLGKGTFGEVYKCKDIENNRLYALKVLLRKERTFNINREIMILESLQGCPNIIGYFGAVKELPVSLFSSSESLVSLYGTVEPIGGPALLFQYVNPCGYNYLLNHPNTENIRFYMLQLLTAIEACHSKGIMHRDVKPENILLDVRGQRLYLIDFGHADYYFPGKEYSIHVCTRYYKGPELLINFKQYDYSLDMWSFGCVLAELIFKCQVFLCGCSNEDQLTKIAQVMGTRAITEYVARLGVFLDPVMKNHLGNFTRVPLKNFVNESNQQTATPLALDLLKKLLAVDHQKRLSAVEAMNHPYFNDKRSGSTAY